MSVVQSWSARDGADLGEEMTTAEVVAGLDDASAAANRIQLEVFAWIRRCHVRRVWLLDDCRDIAHWVALRQGITTYKARRWVACAWALERYPLFVEAFSEGLLSCDKLVELTRVAEVVDEPETKLLSWAKKVAVATIRERGDYVRRLDDDDVTDAVRARSVRWRVDLEQTMMDLHAHVPVEMGMRISGAIDRLARKLAVSPEDYGAQLGSAEDYEATLQARRADALDLICGMAIADDDDADRATVVVHTPLAALLSGDCNGVGSHGEVLAPEVVARLCCDSRLQEVLHGEDGAIVGIGFTSRSIPPWLRRQVEHRDGFRCTFPGCGSRLGLDVHHVVPWPLGPTEPGNLTCLCRGHHKLVHELHWHVSLGPHQKARWFRPDWTPYVPRPPSRVPDGRADGTSPVCVSV